MIKECNYNLTHTKNKLYFFSSRNLHQPILYEKLRTARDDHGMMSDRGRYTIIKLILLTFYNQFMNLE